MPLRANFPLKEICWYEQSRVDKGISCVHDQQMELAALGNHSASHCPLVRKMLAAFVLSSKIFYEHQ